MLTCPKCGASSIDNKKTCGVCGSLLNPSQVTSVVQKIDLRSPPRSTHLSITRRLTGSIAIKAGFLWGILQLGTFWIPVLLVIAVSLSGNPLETFIPSLIIAFLFGYFLHDIDRWVRTFVISQLFAWCFTAIILAITLLPDYTSSNISSLQARGFGFIIVFLVGLAIVQFFVALSVSFLGSYVGRRTH